MRGDKKKPTPGGSRTPTGRPKKVAGKREPEAEGGFEARSARTSTTGEPEAEGGFEARSARTSTTGEPDPVVEQRAPASVVETPEADPVVEQRAPASGVETPEADEVPADAQDPADAAGASTTGRGRRRTTWILVAVIAILALVGIGEIVYLTRDPSPTVSAARPVVIGELSHRAAVEAAARSTEQILSTSYQDYDAQAAKASEKMTDTFAKEYAETSDGIKDEFIAQKTKLQVKAVAQGVVQASPAQVQALLFLNQYVEKEQDGQPKTAFAQYRALVTVVHTDHGWLVSNIETQ
jgi:Mce-associated membrane protein